MNKFKLVRRGQKYLVRICCTDTMINLTEIDRWLHECNIKYQEKSPALCTSEWLDDGSENWHAQYLFDTKSDAIALMLRWL